MVYEGVILKRHSEKKNFRIYKILDMLDEIEYTRYLVMNKDSVDILYAKKDNGHDFFDKEDELSMILIYAYKKCLEIPTQRAKEEGLETYFRFPDMMGREPAVLEIVHKYMEEYPDAVFYVDTGAYFTKTEIDMLYNLEEPDSEWIYKDPKKLIEG